MYHKYRAEILKTSLSQLFYSLFYQAISRDVNKYEQVLQGKFVA